MRVLVTGATGFIGGALVSTLVATGAAVRGLSRTAPAGCEWQRADLTRAESVRGSCTDIDVVFHLAGIAHTRTRGSQHAEVTIAGTRALLAEALRAGVRRFIFISSIKALCSDDDYARSRLAAEDLVRNAPFEAIAIVRPGLVYGPGMKGNLARLLRFAARGWPLPIPEGGAVRSLIHRDDLVRILIALMEAVTDLLPYTLTDGEPYTLRAIYDVMRGGFGYGPVAYALPATFLERLARFGDGVARWTAHPCPWDSQALAPLLQSYFSDDRRVWDELGLKPHYSLGSAMPELVCAYRDARRKGPETPAPSPRP